MKELTLAIAFFANSVACAQLVCVGTDKQCQEARKKVCAEEPTLANLIVPVAATVSGILKDASGKPFKGVHLLLKGMPGDHGVILTTKTDENGRFELGHLVSGQYRLIVLGGAQSAKPERIGFDQPVRQACEGTPKCDVLYILNASPTDQAVNLCSPK